MAKNRPTVGIRRLLVAFIAVAVCVSLTSGASGADAVCASPPPSTIVVQPGVVTTGTAGDDVIYGTPGDDRIAGLGGNDVILGFGGADQLSGGDGNDTLCGGEGNDHLAGGAGNDSLSGEAGNDDLSGGLGDDRLLGDAGFDRLSGGESSDSCGTGGDAGEPAAPADCETTITTTTTTTSTTTSTSTSSTTTSTSTSTTSTTTPQQVQTPAIFLGFADTLHSPGLTLLPDPWQGDPGVEFLGCTVQTAECGSSYDAGAIRIDNPASNPTITLTDAKVVIETCTFTPWGEFLPATITPGETVILTQTGVLGPPQPPPCDNRMNPVDRPYFNFNTSIGPFDTASPPFSNCDPDLVAKPVITLTFSNGMTLTITDADEILNTGGVDRFACLGQDRATPWTPVAPANIVRS